MTKKHRILAIDPGTRAMGVAMLENDRLVYHGVETFPRLPLPQDQLKQVRTAVARLIHDFRPGVLVLEKTFIGKSRGAALLNVLADEIAALGRHRGITVVSIAANTVKKAVTGDGWATKAEVAKAIATRYPKLKAYLPPGRKWKLKQHYNMFDAVALGIACLVAYKARRRSISSRPIRAP
jgi:Holliday junction resolvasome RuvABC endonuclease subunit